MLQALLLGTHRWIVGNAKHSARDGHDSARHETRCSASSLVVSPTVPMGQGGAESLWIARP